MWTTTDERCPLMYAAIAAKEKVQGKEQKRKVRRDVKEKLLQKQYLLVRNTHMWPFSERAHALIFAPPCHSMAIH